MARIPIEDNYDDVLRKAQRGLGITNAELAKRAEVTEAEVDSLLGGTFDEAIARRVARHLKVGPNALCRLAKQEWYPTVPRFPTGFAAFTSKHEDMSVNSYMVWDERTRHAAAFDTGGDCSEMLDLANALQLRVQYIFLTHTHDDHVADLDRLASETGAEIWASENEPAPHPAGKTFKENVTFHIGPFSIKTLSTFGHSPGGTTFFISGLSYPLAIVGDSLFAGSMGGAPTGAMFKAALDNNLKKVLNLHADTVIACGHGPLTTVANERRNNPFVAR